MKIIPEIVNSFTAAIMEPITVKLDAVLAKYRNEVRPAVIRLVPDGFGLRPCFMSVFVMCLQLPRRQGKRRSAR
jgi:hypothetical protein